MTMSPFALFADSGILVTGNARSGTTLLISLLDGHPQIMTIPVETKFSTAMNNPDPVRYLTKERCLAQMREELHRGIAHGFDADRLVAAFHDFRGGRDEPVSMFQGLLYAFHLEFNRLGMDSGRFRFWAEKTPAHFKIHAFFKESFQSVKNIHIVRNPYDLYASWKNRQPGNTLELLIKEAKLSLKHATGRDDGILVVRYEDLVTASEICLARIIPFLGIEDQLELRAPTHLGRPYKGNSSHSNGFSSISSKHVYRFSEHLCRDDFETIRRELPDYLEHFGYDGLAWGKA